MKTNNVLYAIFCILAILIYIYFCKQIVNESKKRTAIYEGELNKENELLKSQLTKKYNHLDQKDSELRSFVNDLNIQVRDLKSNGFKKYAAPKIPKVPKQDIKPKKKSPKAKK